MGERTVNNEDIYTSTGVKFFRHKIQMERYKRGLPASIISTHISPTSECNLNCSYCSVSKRKHHNIIPIEVAYKYIVDAKSYGCKAVILTGGGEPTIYPYYHSLADIIFYRGLNLECGIITNGVKIREVQMYPFSWVRISVNAESINQIMKSFDQSRKFKSNTTVGLSFIYSGKNKTLTPDQITKLADLVGAEYIRLLPDCLQDQSNIDEGYKEIDNWLGREYDKRFFIQYKKKRNPLSNICHQSYFRPYLSEIDGGTIFPCDSIPLNDNTHEFDMKYSLGNNLKDFMEHQVPVNFKPHEDCSGCVFANNIEMLERFVHDPHPLYINHSIKHENFI